MRSLPAYRALMALLALAPALSACVSSSPQKAGARQPVISRPVVREPVRRTQQDPQFLQLPGLEGVIGASDNQLTSQFGAPRLDVREGDARKLQYVGAACILDIYLYPTSRAPVPVATYVDARRASDGRDVDRAACVRALRKR